MEEDAKCSRLRKQSGESGSFSDERVKKRLSPRDDEPIGIVTLTYTRAAKRASGGLRETARCTAHGIRDVSTKGITLAAERFGESKLGERIVPDKHC